MKKTITALLASGAMTYGAAYNHFDSYDINMFWDLGESIAGQYPLFDQDWVASRPLAPDYDPTNMSHADWWIQRYYDKAAGVADSDFDGLLDIEEYIFGTDATQNGWEQQEEFEGKPWLSLLPYPSNPEHRWGKIVQNPAGLRVLKYPSGKYELLVGIITGSRDVKYWYEGSTDLKTWKMLNIQSVRVKNGDVAGSISTQAEHTRLVATITKEEGDKYKCFRLVYGVNVPGAVATEWNDGKVWLKGTIPMSFFTNPDGEFDTFNNWHHRYCSGNWWGTYYIDESRIPAATAAIMAGTYDADGDGVSDLAEYAFGGSPVIDDSKHLDQLRIARRDDNIYLEFNINRDANDLDYWIEGSNNLLQWQPVTGNLAGWDAIQNDEVSVVDMETPVRVPYNAWMYRKMIVEPDMDFRFWRLRYKLSDEAPPIER